MIYYIFSKVIKFAMNIAKNDIKEELKETELNDMNELEFKKMGWVFIYNSNT